jgi:hypothetical protein
VTAYGLETRGQSRADDISILFSMGCDGRGLGGAPVCGHHIHY